MIKKLKYYCNYIWRVLATGFCFLSFGIGAIFLGYIVIPLIRLTTTDSQQKKHRAQHIISISFKLFVFMMQFFGLIKFEFRNFAKLQQDKGCLIISNHPTLIDYVVIVSKLKHCDIIVKEELWRNFALKKVVQLAGYIPNLKFATTLNLIKDTLHHGNNVLIFPEGTRTTPNKPIHLKRGAAQVAVRSGAPIRVLKIECKPSTLTKNTKWYNVPKRKSYFIVESKELIDSKAFLQDTSTPSLAARHLTEYLTNILEEDVTK